MFHLSRPLINLPRLHVMGWSRSVIVFVWSISILSGGNLRADETIEFDNQVMAVISKNGCNAAECHGASGGRGGFQLSLFGSDAGFDFDQIVRERAGRRVHRIKPDESLILLKPTEGIQHEGGLRLEVGSRDYQLIRDWIAQGAQRIKSRALIRIEVDPPSIVFAEANKSHAFRVNAIFNDGETIDVSDDAIVTRLDEESIELDHLTVSVRQPGQHSVIVRYLDQMALLQISLPYSSTTADPLASAGWIDDAVNAKLKSLGMRPRMVADAATLYRRLSLDLLGQLPDPGDLKQFVESSEADKYQKAVDGFLEDPRFVELWAWHLSEWLRVGSSGQDESTAQSYRNWIYEELKGRGSIKTLAHESLVAIGGSENGATGFYRLVADPRLQAELACNVWMGVRIGCANCHNHPLDHWKRYEYYQLSAFFAGIRRTDQVTIQNELKLQNPVTRQVAVAVLPNGTPAKNADPRIDFAEWLVNADNSYFSQTTANRIWAILMGRGIFEPLDDFRQTNPISNRALLDGLATFLAQHNFELRPLIREIVLSEAYRRQTSADSETAKDDFYWRYLVKDIPAPVLLHAIDIVTGNSKIRGASPYLSEVRPMLKPELVLLGQCDRKTSCLPRSSNDSNRHGLAENLQLINGPMLNMRIADGDGFLAKAIAEGKSDLEIINELFMAAYSRPPTSAEQTYWSKRFAEAATPVARKSMLGDYVWAILNSQEFITNH